MRPLRVCRLFLSHHLYPQLWLPEDLAGALDSGPILPSFQEEDTVLLVALLNSRKSGGIETLRSLHMANPAANAGAGFELRQLAPELCVRRGFSVTGLKNSFTLIKQP